MTPLESRTVWDSLETLKGELAVRDLMVERANAVMNYSSMYQIPADLSAAIYDIALAEGINPAIGFRLVQIESSFDPTAKSRVGAIGYTQLMPATARFFMPEIDENAPLRSRHQSPRRIPLSPSADEPVRRQPALRPPGLQPRPHYCPRNSWAQGGNPANGYAEKVVGK